MTDKVQKIKEFLIGMAGAACCDVKTKKNIETIILPFVDSLQEEPVSEDLLKELKGIVNIRECVTKGVPVIKIARHFANWQRQQDNNDANHALVEQIKTQQMCYEKGMADMKQQMMAKAIDVEVKVDAGGYPYIDSIELYDYDNDKPLAKKGDKVKVIFIRNK